MTPLTVAEARAILIADHAMELSFEERQKSSKLLGFGEHDAWVKLVVSARARVAAYERPPHERPLLAETEAIGPSRPCRACNDALFLVGDKCRACGRSGG